MASDRELLARRMADPVILRLHRALSRLGSILTFMNTGAHPDDEHNALLATLRYAQGMRTVICCSTRGEGGQNALGPERGGDLSVIRTREQEEAARVLDASIAWIGHGPQDPVHDFGFSKSGDDTLVRWGGARVVERMVEAFRRYRPDFVLPTFLDVPGQHGHHRAMTRAAMTAFTLADDADAYPEQIAAGLAPWQPARLFLPAWSGAGTSYDDEEPPPPATHLVQAPARDGPTGATFDQVGQWSRSFHATQGMGIWRSRGNDRWPLHLALCAEPVPEGQDIAAGLPRTLADLARDPQTPVPMRLPLGTAQRAIDEAVAAFPDADAVLGAALSAAIALELALAADDGQHGHRLRRKLRELDAVILVARGLTVRARAVPARLPPGGTGELVVEAATSHGYDQLLVEDRPLAEGGIRLGVRIAADAAYTSPYPAGFDPLEPEGVAVALEIGGRLVRTSVALEEPLRILPAEPVAATPDAILINLTTPLAPIAIELQGANASLELPDGWKAGGAGRLTLTPPAGLPPGHFTLRPVQDGAPAHAVREVAYPHVGRVAYAVPVTIPGLAVEAALPPGARIGYVGGGNDRVDLWVSRLGLEVTPLDAAMLGQGDLARFTTILVGIFAFGMRPDLAAATARLHGWTEAGGHLVTLYHRPSDGWNTQQTPPRSLAIGLPSLRWRVTDPNAPVTHLLPDHRLLTTPNAIGPDDWAGWHKERGLYFAADSDPAYERLLAMSDAGERPLTGALVSARIGKGRHTHTSLVLHHQLDRLVPGAFRLLANLLQPAWP